MIVVISDIHFTDGTTSNLDPRGNDLFNVKPKAFQLFFKKIAKIAGQRKAAIKKITLVYNGDMFDLLRTHAWLDSNQKEYPWSLPLNQTAVYKKSEDILKKIVANNEVALSWLSGKNSALTSIPEFKNITFERIYIPGNHDRIINLHAPCRQIVHESLLGEKNNKNVFENYYRNDRHKTIVMHGHEADAFNCEFKGAKPDYPAVPIGDPMTTLLFTRLGYGAKKMGLPKAIVRRFKEIDNVRPALASVRYVQDIMNDFPRYKGKIKKLLDVVVNDFDNLKFYEEWQEKHDRWNFGYDEADQLQFALRAIKLLGPSVPAGALETLANFIRDDSSNELASKRLKKIGNKFRYCILGHTHNPLHQPLFVDKANDIDTHYLNSGTFRTTFVQTYDREHFLRQQRLSFVVIYGPNEFAPNDDIPMYEMWSGIRKHN